MFYYNELLNMSQFLFNILWVGRKGSKIEKKQKHSVAQPDSLIYIRVCTNDQSARRLTYRVGRSESREFYISVTASYNVYSVKILWPTATYTRRLQYINIYCKVGTKSSLSRYTYTNIMSWQVYQIPGIFFIWTQISV